MHLSYDPCITETTQHHTLTDAESHHAIKVLHMHVGDRIGIINGQGLLAQAIITTIHARKCQVEILSIHQQQPPNYSLHIAIAPTKNTDRIDFCVEKVIEIGATHITFLHTQNAVRRSIKLERYNNIAVSAIKQSQRLFLPEIVGLTNVNDFVAQFPNGYIAHCRDGEKQHLTDIFDGQNPILIGPEGDFTTQEIDRALQCGYQSITLSNNRLRTETAGVCAGVLAMATVKST